SLKTKDLRPLVWKVLSIPRVDQPSDLQGDVAMSNLNLRGMNMKKYALAMVMVVLLAAGYSQRSEAQAPPCAPTGTLVTLELYSLVFGGCTIDDKLFGDFDFAAAPGTSFTAADLGYTVIEDSACVPGHSCDGFRFNFGLT